MTGHRDGGGDVPPVPPVPPAIPAPPRTEAAPPGAHTGWGVEPGRSPYASAPPARPAPRPGGAGPAGGAPASPFLPTTPQPGAPGGQPLALPQMATPPLDGVSVASVVTGLLGTGPVALALGLVGLRRTTRAWRRSPRIAGTGVVLGSVGTLAWAVVGVVAAVGGFGGVGTATPGDVSARTVHASLAAPGNCVEFLPPQADVGDVSLVPCASPHVAQVLETWELEGTYPGPEAASEAAQERCDDVLDARGLTTDGHRSWWFAPSAQGWDEGVRTVVCLVRSTTGPLEEDLAG